MNEMSSRTAKLFWSGRSQAVRLPKEFRFDGDQVRIRKEGDRVVLEPAEDAERWAARIAGSFDDDFARAVMEGRLGSEHMPEGQSFD